MMSGKTNPPGGHSREDWAKRVVRDLLRRNPPRFIRKGYVASVIWLVSAIVPTWLLDYAFLQRAKLAELKKIVASQD
jgi:hypothetical protein